MTNPLRSLAARITLLVFVATVISSLTASWISMQSLDGFLRQKVDQRFPQLAASVANELDQWYSLRAREIEVFASSAISSGPKGDRLQKHLVIVLSCAHGSRLRNIWAIQECAWTGAAHRSLDRDQRTHA